jgi:hypothetical protein
MTVARLACDELLCFVCALAAVLAWRMLTGAMQLRGLLRRKVGQGEVSPERVQLLVATVAVSARYLGAVLQSRDGSMPDLEPGWLYVFAGSSGVYAVLKALTEGRARAQRRDSL